jgi:hypothetical protein
MPQFCVVEHGLVNAAEQLWQSFSADCSQACVFASRIHTFV